MFEKEAEEYFRENAYNFDEVTACRECMEFGYNKANEWHYPSKGEYPKDEFTNEYTKPRLPSAYKRFYCLCLGDDCVMGKYMRGLFWTVEGSYSLNEIVAWKEIILPKENE